MSSSSQDSAEINMLRHQVSELQKDKIEYIVSMNESKTKITELESILMNKNAEIDILKFQREELEDLLNQVSSVYL